MDFEIWEFKPRHRSGERLGRISSTIEEKPASVRSLCHSCANAQSRRGCGGCLNNSNFREFGDMSEFGDFTDYDAIINQTLESI